MANGWSGLPGDILISVAKLVGTDLGVLRLRSVCSPWRSSLPAPNKPVSFPLSVPTLPRPALQGDEDAKLQFLLKQNTIYRLSTPSDPSNGWLFKVSDTGESNSFSLLHPLTNGELTDTEGIIIPRSLNLLEYKIHEISRSYSFDCVESPMRPQPYSIIKVIVLWEYVTGCEFVVMLLAYMEGIYTWRLGEDVWTHMDTHGSLFLDVDEYGGKYYAIDTDGYIVYLDSEMNMRKVCSMMDQGFFAESYFVKCDSSLYVISMIGDEDRDEVDLLDLPSKIVVYDVTRDLNFWWLFVELGEFLGAPKWGVSEPVSVKPSLHYAEDLKDKIIFLDDEVSVAVSGEDFVGRKASYICLNADCFDDEGGVYGDNMGIYYFGENKIGSLVRVSEYAQIFWPPPSWLMDGESSEGASDP